MVTETFKLKNPFLEKLNFLGHDEVVALEKAMRLHLKLLTTCIFDTKRELEDGCKIAYLLDFQEIYSYCYKEKPESLDSLAIEYILENSRNEFIIPPGTIIELRDHIFKEINELNTYYKKIKGYKKEYFPYVPDYIKNYDTNMSRKLKETGIYIIDTEIQEKLLSLLNELKIYNWHFTLLYKFFHKYPLRKIDSIIEGITEINFDYNLYTMIFDYLENLSKYYTFRHRKKINNEIDALNITITSSVRNYFEEKANEFENENKLGKEKKRYNDNPFIYLLTHTPALICDNCWSQDKFSRKYGIEERKLMRSPALVLYLTFFENRWPNLTERLEKLNEIKERVETCRKYLVNLKSWNDPGIKKSTEFSIEMWDEDYYEKNIGFFNKEVLNRYLSELKNYINDQALLDIEELISNLQLSELERRAREKQDSFYAHHSALGSIILEVQKIKQQISLFFNVMKKFDINKFTKYEINENKDLGYNLYKLKDSKNRCIIEFYLFYEKSNDFYSIIWPSNIKLDDFVNFVSNYLLSFIKKVRSNDDVSFLRKFKNFNNRIILYTNREDLEISFKLPIDINKIRSNLKNSQLIAVKISSLIGDIQLDCYPHQGNELYCGVKSYYSLKNLITEFFYCSAKRKTFPYILEGKLKDWLSNFKKIEI